MLNIHESGEMYLETIYKLKTEKGEIRSIDVAQEMNFSKPSVSRAMGLLKKSGHITINDSGHINFTEAGLAHAKQIFTRHNILMEFLINCLGVAEEVAKEEACRIEHVISDDTVTKIKDFTAKCKK